jgi:hypothetical protein
MSSRSDALATYLKRELEAEPTHERYGTLADLLELLELETRQGVTPERRAVDALSWFAQKYAVRRDIRAWVNR